MPAKLTLTAQDLKRGTIIEEASWYPIVITAVKEEMNSKGDAKNVVVDGELLPSSDPNKQKYAGVPIRRYFSEKAPGMAKNYITACGVVIGEEGGEFDLEGSVGRQMEAYIKTRLDDNGRMQNDVVDFRPLK